MGATTQWERMQLSAEAQSKLRNYSAWSRLMDGEHIFTLTPPDKTPGADDGGYYDLAAAAKARGFQP